MFDDFAIDTIYSFDIETNQYYDYIKWLSADATQPEPGFEDLHAVIQDAIASVMDRVEACACCGGRDIMIDAYNYYCSHVDAKTNEDLQVAKLFWDTMTGGNGPLAVTADRSEMYLACITEMPYFMDGIDKTTNQQAHAIPFTQLTLQSFTNAVANAKRTFYTNTDDVSDAFERIYNEHSLKKCRGEYRALIVIHNLSYEVMNCLKNMPFFKRMLIDNAVTYLSNNANNTYKSMELRASYKRTIKGEEVEINYPAVYIRDTWKLTGKSISKLGKDHGYPKLTYNYDCIRSVADLTSTDYDYNARDTEIALLGLYDAMCQYDAVPGITLRSFPVSQNNIVSSIAKSLFPTDFKFHKRSVTRGKSKPGARHMTAEQYASYKPTTGGGLVTVNPQFAYTRYDVGCVYNDMVVTGIKHIDLNSAHPSQAFKRFFPQTSPEPVSPLMIPGMLDLFKMDIEEFKSMCTPDAIANDYDRFNDIFRNISSAQGHSTSGYATFNLRDVRAKRFTACGEEYTIPTMWGSKVVRKVSGVDYLTDDDILVSNPGTKLQGKIDTADELRVTMTFEDLAICSMFYDFKIISAQDMYTYKMGPISPYLYQQFVYFGNKKNVYKRIMKACDKCKPYDEVEALCNDPLVSAADRIAILTAYARDKKEGYLVSEAALKVVKAQFNGIYGTAYQSLYRDKHVLAYDEEHDEVEAVAADGTDGTAYDEDNNSGIDVLQGSYIAQWSRIDIAMAAMLAVNLRAVPLYIATDSIYMLITQETDPAIADIFDGKTAAYQTGDNTCKPFNKQTKALIKDRPNGPNLGGMDFERDIQTICYTQPLKVIYHQIGDKEPTITFSGVSADVFFNNCTDVYKRLLDDNGYVSRIDSNKTRKIINALDSSDDGFVLDTVQFVNNNTSSDAYNVNREAAIKWN